MFFNVQIINVFCCKVPNCLLLYDKVNVYCIGMGRSHYLIPMQTMYFKLNIEDND